MKVNILFACLIAAMALYIVFGHNGVLKYREMVAIRQGYEEKIKEMDDKLGKMERELELAKKDREYLENMIRRDLGLQKQGEDLYIIGKDKEKNKGKK